MPKVFVTQIPNKRDPTTGMFVPTINISPAAEHGEVVMLMPPRANFFATADLVTQMKKALQDYDYEAGDSIMSIGDPSVIAVAFAILGKYCGNFTVLKWDKNVGRYIRTPVKV